MATAYIEVPDDDSPFWTSNDDDSVDYDWLFPDGLYDPVRWG